MIGLLSETEVENIVVEKTLDDIYSAVVDLSLDVSALKSEVSVLQEEVLELQELVAEKLDLIYEQLQTIPQYDQLEIVIAFLLMLVFFELMRLLKTWTNSFRIKGGK